MNGRSRALAAVTGAVVLGLSAAAGAATSPVPTVSSVSVQMSGVAGGGRVTVHGSGFTNVKSVRFGTTPGTKLHVTSPSTLLVTIPKHASGLINVTVVTSHGTSHLTKADQVRFVGAPTVTSVSPTAGQAVSSTHVTVHGTDFYSVQKVLFGSVAGAHLTVVSPSTLAVDAPHTAEPGSVSVQVQTRFGTSTISNLSQFEYQPGLLPVTHLNATPTSTSVALTWWHAFDASVAAVDVRRADGTVPPGPTSGTLVASVPPPGFVSDTPLAMSYRDVGLEPGKQYAYTLVERSESGDVSSPASVIATTAAQPMLASPAGVRVSWMHPALTPCDAAPAYLPGPEGFEIAARLADPDFGKDVRFQTQLTQTDPLGHVTDVITFDDDAGWSGLLSGTSDELSQKDFAPSYLVDGDTYTLSLRSDNGTVASEPTAPCSFSYDATPPVASITGPSALKVGQPAVYTLHGRDQSPANGGVRSNLASFQVEYPSRDTNRVAIAARGAGLVTAEFVLTPTAAGPGVVYVRTIDDAGLASRFERVSYFVRP